MRHPFESLSSRQYRFVFRLLLVLTLLMLVLLSVLGIPLQRCRTAEGHACDIVSFELARTPARSEAIVEAWKAQGVLHFAKWNTWLDYVFMVCYAYWLALGIAGLLRYPLLAVWIIPGRVLAWAQWLVLMADAIENAALLRILYGVARTPWPQIAFACAVVKFSLLGLGLVYLAAAFVHTRRMERT